MPTMSKTKKAFLEQVREADCVDDKTDIVTLRFFLGQKQLSSDGTKPSLQARLQQSYLGWDDVSSGDAAVVTSFYTMRKKALLKELKTKGFEIADLNCEVKKLRKILTAEQMYQGMYL
jgi:hypothetical protein